MNFRRYHDTECDRILFFSNFPFSADAKRPLFEKLGAVLGARGREASRLGGNLYVRGAKGRETSCIGRKFKHRRRQGTRSVSYRGKFKRRRHAND
eukprot:UN17094